MNQTSLKHKSYSLYDSRCELSRTFESKNHINIKTNRHRVMENGCIWEGISLNECFCLLSWISQSAVFYQVLNAVQ